MAQHIKALYQYEVFFKLIISGTTYIIDEPTGWDAVKADLPRDKDYFGFVADFLKDEVQLGFALDDIAYLLIKNVYLNEGSDGRIGIEIGYKDPQTNVLMYLFKGNLNLNTYLDDDGEIRCSIEKVSFENLFRTRFDTVIDLSFPLDLDGNPIAPAPVKTTQLHSKVIVKQFESAVTDAQSVNSENISRFVSVKMESASELTSELSGNQALPLSINGIDPRDQDLFFFQIEEDGIYDMIFKASFNFKIMRFDFGGQVGTYYLTPRVMLQRGGVTMEVLEFNAFRRSGATSEKTVSFDMNFDVNINRTLQAGDVIYLDCVGQMQYSGAPYYYSVTNYLNSNKISGQTSSAGSTTLSYLLFDVANYLIGAATGQPNSLISSILDENGDFHDYVLANGFQIRNFLTSSKPLKMSLKEFFEGVFQIAGLGYGFQILNGKEYVVIEKVADFFQMREIIKLDEVYEYKEEHGKDFVYNEYWKSFVYAFSYEFGTREAVLQVAKIELY